MRDDSSEGCFLLRESLGVDVVGFPCFLAFCPDGWGFRFESEEKNSFCLS